MPVERVPEVGEQPGSCGRRRSPAWYAAAAAAESPAATATALPGSSRGPAARAHSDRRPARTAEAPRRPAPPRPRAPRRGPLPAPRRQQPRRHPRRPRDPGEEPEALDRARPQAPLPVSALDAGHGPAQARHLAAGVLGARSTRRASTGDLAQQPLVEAAQDHRLPSASRLRPTSRPSGSSTGMACPPGVPTPTAKTRTPRRAASAPGARRRPLQVLAVGEEHDRLLARGGSSGSTEGGAQPAPDVGARLRHRAAGQRRHQHAQRGVVERERAEHGRVAREGDHADAVAAQPVEQRQRLAPGLVEPRRRARRARPSRARRRRQAPGRTPGRSSAPPRAPQRGAPAANASASSAGQAQAASASALRGRPPPP